MSKYGESPYNKGKEDLYEQIKWFLDDHPLYELLEIVKDVVEECDYRKADE